MEKDPKAKIVGDRRRLLTIHDGARLTPALVAVFAALADEANELLDAGFDEEQHGRATRTKTSGYRREQVDPILVARSDGLAIYVGRHGELA